MADKGGQTTQAGIDYQNKIAALFLGRMISPGPWPASKDIIEVRNEDPSAEVDDVVVRYRDHTVWIQVKLSMAATGDTWIKFWQHMLAQRWSSFGEHDRLVLVISQTPPWVRELAEICGKAGGSKRPVELATLDQQVREWQARLSIAQKDLLNSIVQHLAGRAPAEHLSPQALFELFSHMLVWLQFNPDQIESDFCDLYMPRTNVESSQLFARLYYLVSDRARYGKSISRAELIQELSRENILILGGGAVPNLSGLVQEIFKRVQEVSAALPGLPKMEDLFDDHRDPADSADVVAAIFRTSGNRTTAPFQVPYVGRREGVADTQRALRNALIDAGGTLLVACRGGIGKTREVAELAKNLSNEGWIVCVARNEGDAILNRLSGFPFNQSDRLLLVFDDLHRRAAAGVGRSKTVC